MGREPQAVLPLSAEVVWAYRKDCVENGSFPVRRAENSGEIRKIAAGGRRRAGRLDRLEKDAARLRARK
jgi:hypothetical protein